VQHLYAKQAVENNPADSSFNAASTMRVQRMILGHPRFRADHAEQRLLAVCPGLASSIPPSSILQVDLAEFRGFSTAC